MNSARETHFKVINAFFYTNQSVNGARDQEENANAYTYAWTKTLCKRTLSQYFAKT